MMRSLRHAGRTLGVLLLLFFAMTALGSASILVNKTFTPNSVALGSVSLVTVTLQNDSTSSAATITAFSDDIGTTMAGHATLLSTPAPATTCTGGTPTISGQVLSMNNGQIPIAPSTSAPGSCTITFSVAGSQAGNGFNMIRAANVVTSLGSPSADVSQTLSVQSANVTVTASSTGTVQINDTSTLTFVLTNPAAAVSLASVAFPITSSASSTYTVSGYTTSCGGTASMPPANQKTGTTSFSGLTIPAGGTCTVTLRVTSGNSVTATFVLAASAITDAQGATNSIAVSKTAVFTTGKPTITKSFSPTSVVPGGTTTLTLNVQNALAVKPLTNAALSDTLPTGLTITGTPTANSYCGSPTLGGSGAGTLTFSGGTIAAAHTCTITATVNVPSGRAAGTVTNSVPVANFTSTEAAAASAAATADLAVTASGGGMTISSSISPTTAQQVNAPIKITLNFISVGAALSGGTFSDQLGYASQLGPITSGGAYAPTFSGCGSSSPTITFGGTNMLYAYGSNLAIASGGTCSVSFYVAFNVVSMSGTSFVNYVDPATVLFTGSSGTVSPPTSASVQLNELATFVVSTYVAANSGLVGQPLTVAATVTDLTGTPDSNAYLGVILTTGHVALAAVPNFTFTGCPPGVDASQIAIGGARESFIANLGSINATCTIGYDVIDEGGAAGTWVPGGTSYLSTVTAGATLGYPGINSVTFGGSTTVGITKAFVPNQIQSGGNSTADISLTVPQAGTFARTQANGIAFNDALPANVTFSPTPNVTFTGCQQTGQSAPAYSISGTTISISNVSIVTVGATQTACHVKFDVTSSVAGAPLNQINASAITSTSGITNTQNALASLTVSSGLGIAKTFLNPSFQIGGTDYVRFLVTNSATSSALSGGTLVDAMPSSLVLASTTLGAIQAGDPVLCGGTVAGPVGTGTLNLSGLAVAGLTSPTAPGQCVVYAQVKASASAPAGSVSNTVAAGGLNAGGYSNQTAASASVTLTAPANATVTKTFTPALIVPSAASVLLITIDNTSSGAAALNGIALTDSLPTGVRIAATPAASTTCGAGTLTAVAAATSVALASGNVGANATCTITVSVTGTTAGAYTNTIPASAFTTTQGATNASAATATLSIASLTLSKAFAPATIAAGGTSTLTITIPNGSVALTGVALTDTMPSGLVIAAAPNASTTCPSASVAATAGGTNVALTGGTLAANATCTISVDVTGTTAATYTNTIAANAFQSTQTVTNANAATANLSITPAGLTLSKTFLPAAITAGGTSTVTISIPNTATGAVALTGVGLTDTLPSGLTIASTPNAATTCPAGTVTAAAGSTSVALAGGTLAANATCTLTVDVTATTAAPYTNTLGINALTTTQGVSNPTAATANLAISLAGITLAKAFAPATIVAGGISTLTVTIPNTATGAVALTGIGLTDTLPSGLTIAATPNAATTCPAGTVTAAAGGTNVMLSAGTLAANATCTLTVDVTGTTAAGYTNTIGVNSLTTTQGVSNPTTATANLTIALAAITLSKAFVPATISAGGISVLTITIPNTASGAVALSGVALTDALPSGLTIAATPGASTTCPSGTVTAVAGGTSVALASGTLSANATCTVTVNVTGTVAATYTNAIAANTLATTQGVSNAMPATANLTISLTGIVLSAVFTPGTIVAGGTSIYTITIPNTAAGAVALSGMALNDPLPTAIKISAIPNASTTCGAGTAAAVGGGTTFSLTGGSMAANATCTLSVNVTSIVAGTYTDSVSANALTTAQGLSNPAAVTANLTVTLAGIVLTKAFTPSTIVAGGTSTVTITIPNTSTGAVALSGVALSDGLPSGLSVAAVPNAATSCGAGTIAATAGDTSIALAAGTIAANATCTITVDVTGTTAASYTNTILASALSTTQGVTNAAAATTALTIAPPGITLAKAFVPATIIAGDTSILTITIPNTATGAVALSAMALTDTLPTGVTIAATPNAATTCASGAVTAVAGGASVALAGGTLGANATCRVTVSVTGTAAATYTNNIAANALSTTQGVSNSATAIANLTIQLAAIALSEAFAPVQITAGGTSTLTITIPNVSVGAVALSGMALSDLLPSGVTVAATPNASTTCTGGSLVVTAGQSVRLTNGTLAANATCTISIDVTGTAAATYTNSIAAGALTTTEGASNSAATTNLTIDLSAIALRKAFAPATIPAGGISTLTITIPNTAPGAVSLSAMTVIDTLPSGVAIAATPNVATTCPSGAATAVAGGTSVALAGGTLAANAACTLSVDVTGTVAATYTNTIAPSALGTTEGVSNSTPATANLTIALAAITLSKAFAPAAILAGGTSVLTISIPNTGPGAVALSGVALTDALPTGVTIAATPNAATTCPAGSVTAVAGGTSVALASATLGAIATCTVTVSVTGTTAASYTNTITANALTTTQGVTNTALATAHLTIGLAGIVLSAAFAPGTIVAGGTSLYTIEIPNTAAGAVALSGMGLSDPLPAGLKIAATPNISTTCGAGTLTAIAGGTTFALTGGSVAANASCTISVNVTSIVAATYTDSISGLTTTQGVTDPTATTASLTVTLAGIVVTKAFAPTTISAGGVSTVMITIANNAVGAVALSGMALSDPLPSGVTIAATPNATTTCLSGTATATAGGTGVGLASGTLAANASCTLSVDVTGTTAASYTNTIAANALTTTQGVSNSATATANLTIGLAAIALNKVFSPAAMVAGGTSTLTITIANASAGAVGLSGVALSDVLPSGVTVAAAPNASTTCSGGSLVITAGMSVRLTNGTLAANATCTITISVTGTVAATYTNTIAANALATTQAVSNALPATADLTIDLAGIGLSAAFAPGTIVSGGTSVETITIPNNAIGAVALSGMVLSDALPSGLTVAAVPNAATTCGSGTVTAIAGGTTIALTGGSIAAADTCTITVSVTGSVAATYTNTIAANVLTTTQGVSNTVPTTANLTIGLASIVLTKAFIPATIVAGGTSLLTITIPNTATGAVSLSGMTLSDGLPSGITIAPTPNAATTCATGTVAATPGSANVVLSGGTLAANVSCTISVRVTGTTVGSFLNTIATHALTTAQNVTNEAPAAASVAVTAVPDVTLTKSFSPAAVVAGSTSLLTITIGNMASSSVPLSGLTFTDAYPSGLVNAAAAAGTTTCPAGSVTAVAGSAGLALSGATLAANASCAVTVNVAAPTGTYANTISSVTTAQGPMNVAAATANLIVTSPSTPTIAIAFAPSTIVASGISALTVTIANTGANAIALGNLAFTDTLTGITIAPVSNVTTTCPSGAASGTAGGSAFALTGGSLAAGATCTLTIDVTSSSVGAHLHTIAANALSDTQALSNAAPASATLNVTGLSPVTIVNSFSPPSIVSGQTSLLTIAIANTGSTAIALSGVSLNDALPAGMTVSAAPAGVTTCVAGSVTAAAGATNVALGGATLAAGASCSIAVNVTIATLGAATDTIPGSAFGNTQGAPSVGTASATLTVTAAAAISLTQLFTPSTIVAATTSVLTISLTNAAAGAIPLNGIALGDTLPAGVVLAAIPNASTTCSSGTLVAAAGAATFALSTATLGAGATCMITVSVTAATAGAFANAIAAGTLTSSQGATNVATTTILKVTAVVAAPPLTLTKAFAPASIVSGGASTLTLTLANGAPGAIALTSLTLLDRLPAGVMIAATPNASTTCGAGTAAASPGAATLALANGTLVAGATCTVSVNVTSSVSGSHLDTSAIGAVSDTQTVSNATAASASLIVRAPPALALRQAFVPQAISLGATSVLTFTMANTGVGAIELTAIAFAESLPAGIVLAATPNASTTCSGGAVTAVAGAATFALSAATLAANATCTFVVTVKASSAGTYRNSIAAAAVSDAQGVTNAASQATLTVAAQAALHVTMTSDVAGAGVAAGQTIVYTVTIVNSGTTLVTGAKLTDVLTNATLVANSVTVRGVVAPDAVVKTGAPFGSIAAGATVVIRYDASVNAGMQSGAQVTNTATADSDQGCAGAACSGAAPADSVLSAPKVNVTLLIDGKMSAMVSMGQVVLYSAKLTNVGGASARDVMLTDTLPLGVTPIPGSVTVSNGASASASATSRTRTLASAIATTAVGQSVTASLGTIAAGASATVEFRATITAPIAKVAANTVTVAATGIPTSVTSNVVVAHMQRATLTVTKSASAVVAQIGDRVDYDVRIAAPAGIPFGQTTIVDQLPDYLSYAPGSGRINGAASVPTVSGRTLTWTLPSLGAPVSLTYATAIAAGVSANVTLNNLVTVSAAPLAGGPPGGGTASAAIQIAASTFGTCYPITGRVYDDVKNSGRFESGDTGLVGVSIVLDNGESVVTDAHGRYNFPCVRQGMHALRLDEKTLPDGSVPFADRAIDSERSIHRLVHGIFDDTILQDVNFAITHRAP